MKKLVTAPLVLLLAPVLLAVHGTQSDEAGVPQAAMDYVDALYQAQPELIARSVSPPLTKIGFVHQPSPHLRAKPGRRPCL